MSSTFMDVDFGGTIIEVEVETDEIEGADPSVGIMSAFVVSVSMYLIEDGRPLVAQEMMDLISDEEMERVCNAMTEYELEHMDDY